jgi:hypothetical protein
LRCGWAGAPGFVLEGWRHRRDPDDLVEPAASMWAKPEGFLTPAIETPTKNPALGRRSGQERGTPARAEMNGAPASFSAQLISA